MYFVHIPGGSNEDRLGPFDDWDVARAWACTNVNGTADVLPVESPVDAGANS